MRGLLFGFLVGVVVIALGGFPCADSSRRIQTHLLILPSYGVSLRVVPFRARILKRCCRPKRSLSGSQRAARDAIRTGFI